MLNKLYLRGTQFEFINKNHLRSNCPLCVILKKLEIVDSATNEKSCIYMFINYVKQKWHMTVKLSIKLSIMQ